MYGKQYDWSDFKYPDTREAHIAIDHEKLSGLAEWEVIAGKCGKCGHFGWLDKKKLRGALGDLMIFQIRRRLRCRECWHRGKGTALVIGKLSR